MKKTRRFEIHYWWDKTQGIKAVLATENEKKVIGASITHTITSKVIRFLLSLSKADNRTRYNQVIAFLFFSAVFFFQI